MDDTLYTIKVTCFLKRRLIHLWYIELWQVHTLSCYMVHLNGTWYIYDTVTTCLVQCHLNWILPRDILYCRNVTWRVDTWHDRLTCHVIFGKLHHPLARDTINPGITSYTDVWHDSLRCDTTYGPWHDTLTIILWYTDVLWWYTDVLRWYTDVLWWYTDVLWWWYTDVSWWYTGVLQTQYGTKYISY